MATIYASKGQPILVDDDDYSWLSQYRWVVGSSGYAVTWLRRFDGKQRHVTMHRMIMDPPSHLFVDHINHNRADNRRHNLRLATRKENQNNQLPQRIMTYDRATGKYWLLRGCFLVGIYETDPELHQAWIDCNHHYAPPVTNTTIPID